MPSVSSYGCHHGSRTADPSHTRSLTLTHSYSPNFEWVRPRPESLTPPHAHWQAPWLNMWSLIHTIPDCSSAAIRSPRARSEVHTDAPSPNSESLASATASASESTTMIGSTGPKISSRMIRMSCVTPVSTAGA